MTLLFHHFCKDIRSVRWLLLGYIVFLILMVVLTIPLGNESARNTFSVFLAFLGAAILAILTIMRAVLDDPVPGSDSLWLTRPLGRVPVLGAKIVLVIFLAVFYAIAHTAMVAVLGAGDLASIFAGRIFFAAGIFLPVMLASGFARSLRTSPIVVFVAYIAFFVISSFMVFVIRKFGSPERTDILLILVWGIVTTSGIAFIHWKLRNLVVAGVLAFVAMVVAATCFHTSDQKKLLADPDIDFVYDWENLHKTSASRDGSDSTVTLSTNLNLRNASPGSVPFKSSATSTIKTTKGEWVTENCRAQTPLRNRHDMKILASRLYPEFKVISPLHNNGDAEQRGKKYPPIPFSETDKTRYAQMFSGFEGEVRATFMGDIYTYFQGVSIPLQKKTIIYESDYEKITFHPSKVASNRQKVEVTLEFREFSRLVDDSQRRELHRRMLFLLVDREKKRICVSNRLNWGSEPAPPGCSISHRHIGFAREDGPEDWLEGMELVVLIPEYEGAFTKEVVAENVRFPGKPGEKIWEF